MYLKNQAEHQVLVFGSVDVGARSLSAVAQRVFLMSWMVMRGGVVFGCLGVAANGSGIGL